MKVAIFSDLHVGDHSEHARPSALPGVTDRMLETISVLSDVRGYCREHDVEHVLFGGDLWHKRAVLGVPAHNLVVEELVAWKKQGLALYALPGNHDQADKAGAVDAIQSLGAAGLLRTVSGRGTWDLGDLLVSGFSYCDDRDLFSRRLEEEERLAGSSTPRILLLHHGFKGARVGTHLEYEVKEPMSAAKRLKGHRFQAAFSGHYHSRQPIRGLENGTYVGSPMEFTRATRDEREKGFLAYDSERNEAELVPLKRPRFVAIGQAELDAGDFSKAVGNFVDVSWSDFPGGPGGVAAALQEAGARAWKLIKDVERAKPSLRQAVDPAAPPAQALAAYLEAKGDEIRGLGLSRKRVMKKALEVLQRAGEEE